MRRHPQWSDKYSADWCKVGMTDGRVQSLIIRVLLHLSWQKRSFVNNELTKITIQVILVSFFGVETSRLKALNSFNIRMPQHQSISEHRKTHLREWLRSDLTDDICMIYYFQVSQVFREYCTWDVFCFISKVFEGLSILWSMHLKHCSHELSLEICMC